MAWSQFLLKESRKVDDTSAFAYFFVAQTSKINSTSVAPSSVTHNHHGTGVPLADMVAVTTVMVASKAEDMAIEAKIALTITNQPTQAKPTNKYPRLPTTQAPT